MIEQIFLKVMDMSWSAGMIIAVVLIVRVFLKRFPKFISYMLWSVVFFRLLCPVTIESEISPVPDLSPAFYEYKPEKAAAPMEEVLNEFAVPYIGGERANVSDPGHIIFVQFSVDEDIGAVKVSWQEMFILFGKYVWIIGIGIMFLYCVISTAKIHNKVSVSIPFKNNIYITDETVSPFVMGMFNPRIYLPTGLSDKEQEYIILHEKFHIRRFDHVVKPVAFAALCIHWFNPLVWTAFILFCKDMEMSCDEAVIKKMGENIRADYSFSLLSLSTKHRTLRGIPVDFGEGDTKGRIKNLAAFRKTKKGVLAVLTAGVVILILCLASTHKTSIAAEKDFEGKNNPEDGSTVAENTGLQNQLNVSLDITEHYRTKVGDPSNFFYIDENNVLWGSGKNERGQLGQGTWDYFFHSEKVKIAENVIDVDYSQRGFVIFLTADHKLYGMGNAGCGALQKYEDFDYIKYTHEGYYHAYCVREPYLLMENVVYARCGRDDIACLTEDGEVWVWGTIYCEQISFSEKVFLVSFVEKPKKILDNAVLVTGGWFNHAALLQDGTVWTWGYNGAGNCGVADRVVVSEPTMVAEDVVMVWTDLTVGNNPQPGSEDAAMALTGSLNHKTEYDDIAEFGSIYPRFLNNTVIQKADGSYWVCGENVGTQKKVMHSAEGDYFIICTYEFHPCQ